MLTAQIMKTELVQQLDGYTGISRWILEQCAQSAAALNDELDKYITGWQQYRFCLVFRKTAEQPVFNLLKIFHAKRSSLVKVCRVKDTATRNISQKDFMTGFRQLTNGIKTRWRRAENNNLI